MRTCAELRAQGWQWSDVAEKVGISEHTARHYALDPDWPDMLAAAQERQHREFMKATIFEAWQALRANIEHDDAKYRNDAAGHVIRYQQHAERLSWDIEKARREAEAKRAQLEGEAAVAAEPLEVDITITGDTYEAQAGELLQLEASRGE